MDEKNTNYAKWLNGELSPTELEQLRASGELEELEAVIRAAEDLALPKYDLSGAYQKFKAKHPSQSAKMIGMKTRWVVGIAASLALLVAAIFLFGNKQTQIVAANSVNESHVFLDGSSAVLNDGSSLIYDEKKWATQRIVQLKGEAFFSVEKGASFIVETPNGEVEVLGTGFNIRAWGDNLHVECYYGKVKVSSKEQSTILTQNESVMVATDNMQNKQSIGHQKPLWSTGISRFYSENINDVFAELERQYDVVVNAPKLNRSFSGSFQHDNLNLSLNNICKPLNIRFNISEDNKTVTIEAGN